MASGMAHGEGEGVEVTDPISSLDFDRALATVQQVLDLRAVAEAYGATTEERSDGHLKMRCVLPSREPGCEHMTCSEQDASENGGDLPSAAKLFPTDVDGYWRWHCYSCRRGGDVVDFVAHREGWALNEARNTSLRALRRAAKLAGVSYLLDNRPPSEADVPELELVTGVDPVEPAPKLADVDAALAYWLNKHLAAYWHASLLADQGAAEHVAGRGILAEQVERYRLGYAGKSWDSLRGKIKKEHHPVAVRLGVLQLARSGNLIDVQRDRLVFPYIDGAGNVTGFAGRRVDNSDPKAGPKFVNSLNVASVWEKRSQLFGVWQALARARALGYVVVCEGPADVLAFDRIDVPAVALVGVAMTAAHAQVIRDVLGVSRVLIALDGDDAGRRPVPTCIASLVSVGYTVDVIDVVNCDDGRDPDEMQPDTLRARTLAPTPAREYLAARECAVPEPPAPITPELLALQQQEAALAESLARNVLGPWKVHAEFKAWHDRDTELRAELARVRKLIKAAPAR